MTVQNKKLHDRGMEITRELGRDPNGEARLGHVFWDFTAENCFGLVWGRPGLSLRDRALVTLGVLIAADNDGINSHLRMGPEIGIDEAQMREIIFQAMTYAGWPRGSSVTKRFNAVLAEPNSKYKNFVAKPAAAEGNKNGKAASAKASTGKATNKVAAKASAKATAKPAAKKPARARA